MCRTNAIFNHSILIVGIILGTLALTYAQEVEPNSACSSPQDLGSVTLPITVTGSLDTPQTTPDIDYFKVTLPEATEQLVEVKLAGLDAGVGTLEDPFLGLFDSACRGIASNDDDSSSYDSRVLVFVPADGVLIVAATSNPDDSFTGHGEYSGSYQLTMAPALPPIDSITGRVINAVTGLPLRGDGPSFASVELVRCRNGTCMEGVITEYPDFAGRFRFDRDFYDEPLAPGTYQVRAFAEEFLSSQTEPFDIESGEARDLGDFPLTPVPIQVSNVQPCADIPAQGGSCRYHLTFHNVSLSRFDGAAWSVVTVLLSDTGLEFSTWQTGASDAQPVSFQPVVLAPGEQTSLEFEFDVPNTVAVGANVCVEVFVGENPSPRWHPVMYNDPFCISKSSVVSMMKPTDTARHRRQQLRRAVKLR